MSSKNSERAQKLLKNFMSLHNSGYSIPEIAEMHGLNPATVYRHLQEIADANGVTRESLLERVNTPSSNAFWQRDRKKSEADFAEMRKTISAISSRMDRINQILGGMDNDD